MINTAVIMGRITADPELRTTTGGIHFCRFSVAVDRSFQRAGEERKTDFINVVVWRQTAEFVTRYFHKGSMIAVEGSIQTGSYTDKDGNKRNTFEIVGNNVSFTGSKSETSGSPANNNYAPAGQAASYATGTSGDFDEIVSDDDLPF